MDGREILACSPVEVFERLRDREHVPPAELGRYLDLLRSRGAIGFGVDLDVGLPDQGIERRCERAMASLMNHGWLRMSEIRSTRQRGRLVALETRS
jgi:hypothetical protein